MSNTAMEAARLIDMLPETDRAFALGFIKKLVRAWDPDYTKVSAEEARQIEEAENSGFISEEDIHWDDLSKYAE